MAKNAEQSLSPEFKRFAPLFQALTGKILDAPCGLGRHSFYLQRLGCSVTCLDIDDKALNIVHSKDKISGINKPELEILHGNLTAAENVLEGQSYAGVLNVHFFEPTALLRLAHAVVQNGLFYFESIANRGGNYEELPATNQIRLALEEQFFFLYYKEKTAGPPEAGRVTARALARKK